MFYGHIPDYSRTFFWYLIKELSADSVLQYPEFHADILNALLRKLAHNMDILLPVFSNISQKQFVPF